MFAAWVLAACAAPGEHADQPAILRRWTAVAPPRTPSPVAAVVDSAAQWELLRFRWGLPAVAMPAGVCDFAVARCLLVVLPDGVDIAPSWSEEEGIEVLTLLADEMPAAAGARLHGFVLPHHAARLAVVYRPAAGGEVALWCDPAAG